MYFLLKKHKYWFIIKTTKPNPGMFDPPFLFEPTLTFWESKIAGWMSDLTSW